MVQKTMGYQDHAVFVATRAHSVTFCSCICPGTEIEQTRAKREAMMLWAKDMAAGVGLVLFMVGAFLLASGAQSLINPV